MLSKFSEKDIKDFVRKVDELHAKLPTLDDYLLLEVFLSENSLNRREPNSARKVAEQVMARWRKEMDLKAGLERGNPMDYTLSRSAYNTFEMTSYRESRWQKWGELARTSRMLAPSNFSINCL
jgi:hypothetical protein